MTRPANAAIEQKLGMMVLIADNRERAVLMREILEELNDPAFVRLPVRKVTGFALFDTSTKKKYMKKRRDGCLCFYEDEVDARLAKSRFEDTDYMAANLIAASKGEGNE